MSALDDIATVLGIAQDVAPELLEIARYVRGESRDPETEMRLAMALIRRAADEQAKREIQGG